jgi:hypothetical protein
MLTIICGEDTVASRNYYQKLTKTYFDKGYYLQTITYQEIPDILKGLSEINTLFNDKKIFLTENLDRNFRPLRKNAKTLDTLQQAIKLIDSSKEIELIDWEDGKSTWELKLKNLGQIKEFKQDDNIFKFQESCYPGNRLQFYRSLIQMVAFNEDGFIFIMLVRYIRQLILAQASALPTNIPPWQRGKLYNQAKLWNREHLIKFYQGLQRIDFNIKTGSNPQTIKDSLDILACYFL